VLGERLRVLRPRYFDVSVPQFAEPKRCVCAGVLCLHVQCRSYLAIPLSPCVVATDGGVDWSSLRAPLFLPFAPWLWPMPFCRTTAGCSL
jgi:hypothetical protein